MTTTAGITTHIAYCERDNCPWEHHANTEKEADRAAHEHCIIAGHTVIRENRWRLT